MPIITLSDILRVTPQGNNLSQDDILCFANDNIHLASSAFVLLCHARKELEKGDLHADYFKLCSKNIPISRFQSVDWLFGDDVGKQVKGLGQDKLKSKLPGRRHPGGKQFNIPTTYYSSKQDKGRRWGSWSKQQKSEPRHSTGGLFLYQGQRRNSYN